MANLNFETFLKFFKKKFFFFLDFIIFNKLNHNNFSNLEGITLDSNTILFDAFRDKLENRNPIKNNNDLLNLRWGEDSHL
jgi:hypothetical protein